MLKTALVGCGAISKVHFAAISKLDKITSLVACCDENINKAREKAEDFGIKAYSSLEEMVNNEDIDVLHICTPHYLHVPMAKFALEKNINVLTEKPVAISREQYEELKVASQGKRLGICFQNRYNGAVVRAKEILDSGKYGKIKGVRAIVTWSRNEKYYVESGWRGQLNKEGGGVLINQSIHTLDLITYLCGKPLSVSAQSSNNHLKGIINEEDTMTAFLHYEDYNALFFATTAFCVDSPVLLEIILDECSVKLEGNTINVKYSDGTVEQKDYSVSSTLGKLCWGNSHNILIEEYYNALLENRNFPVNIDSVYPSFTTMMGIYESAKNNKTVSL